jgi:YD repeat-containing protein
MNNIIVVDFNKDGKDDIITFQADFDRKTSWGSSYYRFNKMIITHYKATNSGFSKIEYVNAGSETYSHAKYFMSGDFNGDGNNDILNYGYQYLKTYNSTIKWRSLTNFNNDFDSELVKSITDGFGNNTTYSYRPLTDKGCVSNSFAENEISAKNWRSKGVISLRTPLYVVSDLMSSNGIGGNTLIKYKYDSPLFHNHGRGFLGFLRAESDNTNLDIKEKRYYKLNDFYIINRLWKTETFNRNQLVSRVESVDGFKGFLNKGFYVYIANSTQNDIVNGIEVTTANVYDDFGNLKEQTANYGSDVTVSLANTFTSKGSWCDSKVKTSTKTTTYKGESPFSINSSYTYYDNGNLETSNSNGVTTRYLYYDAYRNAKTVTLIASGAESRSTKYEYDDKFHRFVKKVTNPLNQTESFTYNNWGKVLTITDIAGNVSSNKYDAWGVLTETTHPNNKKSTNSIHWAENNNYNALYYTKTINEGAPYEKVLYDQKGRVVGQGNRI